MRGWRLYQKRNLGLTLLAVVLLASACITAGSDDGETADSDGLGSEAADGESGDGQATDDADSADGDDGSAGGDMPVGAVADPASLATIEAVGCSFDELIPLAVTPVCHEVSVPENWADPDPDDQVVLQVAVFEGDGSQVDPIIYFDGGPGGHTLDLLSFTFDTLVEPLLSDRDYIVFDQRGLGESEPSLACPEIVDVSTADLAGEIAPEDAGAASLEAIGSCRDRLVDSGVDLTAYNSVASANDVEAIRSLLAYDEMNVVGISYGTRLAQTYMRMYPDSVRSVTLDSVFPNGVDLWTNFTPSAERAYEQLFAGCAASPDCAATYPDFEERYFELLDQLDEEPAEVELQNLILGTTSPGVFDGDDVMGLVFSAMYDRGRFATIPQMVEDGLNGNFETIELFGSIALTNLNYFSQGMQLSVECNEELVFESFAEYEANLQTELPYSRLADMEDGQSIFELCEEWPAGAAPEVESQTVSSDIPTLVLAGQYDPITPPSGVDVVREGLPNSYAVLFPNEGHGLVPTDCGAAVVNGFIADPTSEPDASCVSLSPEPVWTIGTNATTEAVAMVDFEVDGLVAISGVRPEGWTDAGNGVFSRQQTATDPTLLLVQPTGGLSDVALLELLQTQLDLELIATGPAPVGGVEWTAYETSAVSGDAARAAIRPGPDGILVLLVARAEELDGLYDAIFLEAAEAATVG